jgi:hypothetical protein
MSLPLVLALGEVASSLVIAATLGVEAVLVGGQAGWDGSVYAARAGIGRGCVNSGNSGI